MFDRKQPGQRGFDHSMRDPFASWPSRQWVRWWPGTLRVRQVRSRMSGKLTAQRTQLLKPSGGVTHDRGDADYLPGIVGKGHDGELDRDPCAILPQSRHRQDVAVSVAGRLRSATDRCASWRDILASAAPASLPE